MGQKVLSREEILRDLNTPLSQERQDAVDRLRDACNVLRAHDLPPHKILPDCPLPARIKTIIAMADMITIEEAKAKL